MDVALPLHLKSNLASMRFSLGRLLLVFPAFLLGTFVAMFWQSGARIKYRHTVAINEMHEIENTALDLREYHSGAVADVLTPWLEGTLPGDIEAL
jgi:hypothetical protein